MDTSHCLRRHGFILLLILFHSSMFISLASELDVSYDARSIKVDGDRRRFLSDFNHHPPRKFDRSHQQGKKHRTCTNPEPDPVPITFLSCQDGYIITKINFADYGNPTGTCQHFRHGNCGAPATLRLVKKNCLGKNKCVLFVTDEMFGPSHCRGVPTLAVEATCTKTS